MDFFCLLSGAFKGSSQQSLSALITTEMKIIRKQTLKPVEFLLEGGKMSMILELKIQQSSCCARLKKSGYQLD